MFLKLVRGKEVISPSSYLDVLKIMVKMRENDLNRQIYPYLKIDLQQIIKKKKKMTHQLNQSPHLILILINFN